MIEWMASLYDPETGAWYHSRSGQMKAYCFLCQGEIQLYAEYHLSDAYRYHFEWTPSFEAFAVPERDDYYRNVYAPIRSKALSEIGAIDF